MRYRKARIAWSAVCGILCLLLIGLWVRSYWQADYLLVRISAKQMLFTSSHWGRTEVSIESWRQPPIPDAGYLGCPANRVRKGPYWFYKSGPADSRLGAELPHLSVTMLMAMLAVVPWTRRFSLRTLLIVITLFAAFLASIVASN